MQQNNIKLEGFEQFIKLVQNLPDKMKSKAMMEIMKNNLKPVAMAIKNTTPISSKLYNVRYRKAKGDTVTTIRGNLRRSIDVRGFSRGNNPVAYAGIQKKGGADGWYGFFLERGTKYISKNPFINRAATMMLPIATEMLTTDIKGYIAKNARKLGLDTK